MRKLTVTNYYNKQFANRMPKNILKLLILFQCVEQVKNYFSTECCRGTGNCCMPEYISKKLDFGSAVLLLLG